MNLLLDMNIPEIWVPFLSEAGHRATHWSRVGDIRAEDTAIMRWAKAHGQVIFTNDLDFGALLYLTDALAPSVVQTRAEHIVPRVMGTTVLEALSTANPPRPKWGSNIRGRTSTPGIGSGGVKAKGLVQGKLRHVGGFEEIIE